MEKREGEEYLPRHWQVAGGRWQLQVMSSSFRSSHNKLGFPSAWFRFLDL